MYIVDEEFNCIINDIVENEVVQQMNNYKQHYNTSCFEHCLNVSYYSYLICKKYNLDYKAVARAGMLHDLFLYDWRKKRPDGKRFHAFSHPKKALENSTSLFDLSKKEQDIILKHMWPITLKLPKYKESYILTLVDKFCALKEAFENYKQKPKLQRFYRYGYIFTCMIIVKLM